MIGGLIPAATQSREEQTNGTTDEADHLQRDTAPAICQNNRYCDPNQKTHINQRSAASTDQIRMNDRSHIVIMADFAKGHADDHRRENANPVGGEILQEPGQ